MQFTHLVFTNYLVRFSGMFPRKFTAAVFLFTLLCDGPVTVAIVALKNRNMVDDATNNPIKINFAPFPQMEPVLRFSRDYASADLLIFRWVKIDNFELFGNRIRKILLRNTIGNGSPVSSTGISCMAKRGFNLRSALISRPASERAIIYKER